MAAVTTQRTHKQIYIHAYIQRATWSSKAGISSSSPPPREDAEARDRDSNEARREARRSPRMSSTSLTRPVVIDPSSPPSQGLSRSREGGGSLCRDTRAPEGEGEGGSSSGRMSTEVRKESPPDRTAQRQHEDSELSAQDNTRQSNVGQANEGQALTGDFGETGGVQVVLHCVLLLGQGAHAGSAQLVVLGEHALRICSVG